VDHSHAKVRADVAYERLLAMGFAGDERTVRRAVAEAKAAYRAGHRGTYRPWVPEPGIRDPLLPVAVRAALGPLSDCMVKSVSAPARSRSISASWPQEVGREGAKLLEQTELIRDPPALNDFAAVDSHYTDPGQRYPPAHRGDSDKWPLMSTGDREAINQLVAFPDQVLDFEEGVRKSYAERRQVTLEVLYSRPQELVQLVE